MHCTPTTDHKTPPFTRLALCVALLLLVPLVPAQTLNLGPPPEPVVGDDNALAHLEDRLVDGIEEHATRLDNARGANDPDWIRAASLSIAARALALRMIRPDATLPGARAIRIVQAKAITEAAQSIDDLARASVDLSFEVRGREPDDHASVGTAARAEAAQAAIEAFLRAITADPEDPRSVRSLPATAPELDRFLLETFDELRPLVRAIRDSYTDIEPAWPAHPGAPPAPANAIASARTSLALLPEPQRDTVAPQLDALARAERLPIHRRSARTLARTIDETIRATDTVAKTEWLGQSRAAIPPLAADLTPRLLSRSTRDDAVRAMHRVQLLARLVAGVDTLDERRINTLPARRAVTSLMDLILLADETPAAQPRLGDLLSAADRILTTAAERTILEPAQFGNGAVRRAWRLMERDYEQSERFALDALGDVVADPALLVSPDVISRIKRHHDASEDLRRVALIPSWQRQLRADPSGIPTTGSDEGQSEPDALPDTHGIERSIRSGAADRLEALARALGRDEVRDRVLARLAEFEDNWAQYAKLPGEDPLRRAHPAAVAVTGGRAGETLAAMRRDRQEWLVTWAAWKLEEAQVALDRLVRYVRIGRAIETCVLLSEPDRLDALDRWAAVEFSRPGVGVVRRGAKWTTEAIIDAMIRGEWETVDIELTQWDESAATAKLLARFAREAEAPNWPPHDGIEGLIAQVGSGIPHDAWLRSQRIELAELSLWILELGTAADADNDPLAHNILAYLDELSARLRESLDIE